MTTCYGEETTRIPACAHYCVQVCICRYMCIYVDICMYVCIYICVCVYVFVCVGVISHHNHMLWRGDDSYSCLRSLLRTGVYMYVWCVHVCICA